MTLLLSISSHSCCYQQAKAGVAGADTGRQIKQTGEEGGMMRGEQSDERLLTCTFGSSPLLLSRRCGTPSSVTSSPASPSISALIPLPPSLIFPPRQAGAALRRKARAQVCGSGLPPPNETPSARFQTFSASLAFSNAGSKVVDRERLGRGGRRDESDGGRDWQRGEEESSGEEEK